MMQPYCEKALTNESECPYITELAVTTDGLDITLSRRIMAFHNSRHIEPHHGRRLTRGNRIHYRRCFCDLATAHAFVDEFGGELLRPRQQ